jgi:hypothetical protein
MNYEDEGRELRSNWGFWLPREGVNFSSGILKYGDNFVDCGQLSTIFANPQSTTESTNRFPNDIHFGRMHGRLPNRLRLDLGLQILINGRALVATGQQTAGLLSDVPIYGNILELELPDLSRPGASLAKRALVISSPAVDGIRNTVRYGSPSRILGHITVVPLEDPKLYRMPEQGIALVEVRERDTDHVTRWLANCQEVLTIDWRDRRARIVGQVPRTLMSAVDVAVRQYLDLPPVGGEI